MWEKEAFKKFIPKIPAIFQVVAQTTIKMMHCNLFEKKTVNYFYILIFKATPFFGYDLTNAGQSYDVRMSISERVGYYR